MVDDDIGDIVEPVKPLLHRKAVSKIGLANVERLHN